MRNRFSPVRCGVVPLPGVAKAAGFLRAQSSSSGMVFAGTLGKGLLIYRRSQGRWTTFTTGLPSLNVTALASAGGFLYVGTDNGLVRITEANL